MTNQQPSTKVACLDATTKDTICDFMLGIEVEELTNERFEFFLKEQLTNADYRDSFNKIEELFVDIKMNLKETDTYQRVFNMCKEIQKRAKELNLVQYLKDNPRKRVKLLVQACNRVTPITRLTL
jgi:hypothetical protein